MDYYITYNIALEALNPTRLLELLNSFRLELLTKYKELTDIYYDFEDDVLFQYSTNIQDQSHKKAFHSIHLNDTANQDTPLLAEITYDLLNDQDVFDKDLLCALHVEYINLEGPQHLYGLYNDRTQAFNDANQLYLDGFYSKITITKPNQPIFKYQKEHKL